MSDVNNQGNEDGTLKDHALDDSLSEERRCVDMDAHTTDKPQNDEMRTSGKKRFKQIMAVIAGIIVCIILIAPSIAGYLNVSVISTSGTFTGIDAEVLLYEGDVTAVLMDGDPANDPEPKTVNSITVGQRTTFNGMNFGTYTITVELLDEQAASQVAIVPRTVTMWGIDNTQTYEIA